MIKVLGVGDIEEILAISSLRPKRKERASFNLEDITGILAEEKNVTIGFFFGDEMTSWASARFGELHGEKVWYIIFFAKKTVSNFFSYADAGFGELIHYFRSYGETQGYYTYLYSIAVKAQQVYYDKWPDQKKYNIEDVAIIPAGTAPESPWMLRLMGGTKPYDVVIKQRTLRDEFRAQILSQHADLHDK